MSESKVCPNCNEKNNPTFQKCWKCGIDFATGKMSIQQHERDEKPANIALCCALGCIQSFFLYVFSQAIRGDESLFVALLALALLIASVGIFSKRKHAKMFFIIATSLSVTWAVWTLIRSMRHISASHYPFYFVIVAVPTICLYIITRPKVEAQFK